LAIGRRPRKTAWRQRIDSRCALRLRFAGLEERAAFVSHPLGVFRLSLFDPGALAALATVIVIDVTLAGDNAIAVAMAAAGLAPRLRRQVILAGTLIATALRIALATVAMRLLAIIGLTLAGGLLLLFVAWKLYRELRAAPAAGPASGATRGKSFGGALVQVLAADVSMSLDNVLAIAGASRDNFVVLVIGLTLSVGLMGIASNVLAPLMERHRWISWIGLAVITFVASRMIVDGSAEIIDSALGG
jgi:YjbE family integral membrane protein